MTKTKFIVIVLSISSFGIIVTSPPAQMAKWMVLSFLAPSIMSDIKESWEKKSSRYLLRKLKSHDFVYSGTAAQILADRKEKEAVPVLIKNLNSLFWLRRGTAIQELGNLGDPRAIKPLMKIIRRRLKNNDYLNALHALAKLKYDPIYPLITDIVRDRNGNRAFGVTMLESFGKAESLPLLKEIYENDKKEYIRERARKAIEKINRQLSFKEKAIK